MTERPGLTRWENLLRGECMVLALVALGFAAYYTFVGVFHGAEFPFATNSVAKDGLLAGVLLLVYWDVRRWASAVVPLIVIAHVVMPVLLLATMYKGSPDVAHTLTTGIWILPAPSAALARWSWFSIDVLTVASLLFVQFMAVRSRYGLRYLWPASFRALTALAEILVPADKRLVTPVEVAMRVDRYLAGVKAREKYRVHLAFLALAVWPVALLRPPFHVMSPQKRQQWIQSRFLDEVRDWLVPRLLRDIRRASIRTAQQFCFMGYYGDPRAAAEVGYLPYTQREGAKPEPAQREPLRCMRPQEIPHDELTVDVAIVGSGAGGALLASELARRGRDVVLLERGAHVPPGEFTEDEATQLARLYSDGALTLTKDFRFQVLQGMCVGGSTVVNNGVCIPIPDDVLAHWVDRKGANSGLEPERFLAAFDEVRRLLQIAAVTPESALSPGGLRIAAGLREDPRVQRSDVVHCNIDECIGCGYCNIGCKYGRKLSALDWTLPRAQQAYGDRVRILPGCRVEKVLLRDDRATGVAARLDDGRKLTVRANTVILSAGAIASSLILQRSGLGEGRAGRGLAFNMGSPVTFDFDEPPLHAERGLQITHVYRPREDRYGNLAFETWFNPIVSQSLFMPGWFEAHWANMRRYKHMTCLGVVTGSGNDASVKSTFGGRGMKFDYTPSDRDFVALKHGIRLACELGLDMRAARVMPSTLRLMDIRSKRELTRIDDEIGDDNDVVISTSHPQGGNAMSLDGRRGVVDPEFRVHGTTNLFVCDASVFPTSITVNPQMTVMALAVYAADAIAGGRSRVELPDPALRARVVGAEDPGVHAGA